MTSTRAVGPTLRRLVTPGHEPSSGDVAVLRRHPGQVLTLAREHRVLGPLGAAVERTGIELPSRVADELADARAAATVNHLRAVRALRELAEVLDVPWAVVKGPVLSTHWYGDPGWRAYGDVDLLVGPGDLAHVLRALVDLGHEELADNWGAFLDQGVAEMPLERHGVTVDLHWHLVGVARQRRHLRLSTAAVLARATPVDVAGGVPTPDPVDTLVHLCVHAGLAGARRLLHLLDVDVVVRSGRVDLDLLVRRARRQRCAGLVVAVLDRAVRLLGTPVPQAVLTRLEPFPGLRRTLRTTERIRHDGATGLGVVVEGVRDTPGATAAEVVARTAEALRVAAGGTPRTHDEDALSWVGPSRPAAVVRRQRAGYLAWVADVADDQPHTARRTAEPGRLLTLFGADQPATTVPLAHAASTRRLTGPSRTRAWVVRGPDGSPTGALVTVRMAPLLTLAHPLVRDPAAAAAVGRLVQRSAATHVLGLRRDVAPLEPHVDRWHRAVPTVAAAVGPTGAWAGTARHARVASGDDAHDLDDLTTLLGRLGGGPTWVSRLLARTMLGRGVAVLRRRGEPVGYATVAASTPTWDVLGALALLPEWRGQGLAWDAVHALVRRAQQQGRGVLALPLAGTPMTIPDELLLDDPGQLVVLRPPRRFRGEVRLRRLAARLLGGRWPGIS